MEFRLASFNEIKEVVEICEKIKETYPFWDEEYPIIDNFIESFNEHGLYVLIDDSLIVGSICVEDGVSSSDCKSLSRFMVRVDKRKQGYGKTIFESVEKEIKKQGFTKIDFLVHKDHPFAFKMYQKFGYADCGLFATAWDDGKPHYHLFKKDLNN